MKNNEQIKNLLANLEVNGKEFIAAIGDSNLNFDDLTQNTELLSYIKIIYDELSKYGLPDSCDKELIIENDKFITKEDVLDTVKNNLSAMLDADSDSDSVEIFLAGLKATFSKKESSYYLAYELEDIVERNLDDIVDGAEKQVIQGEGIHGYLNLPFDGRLYLLQTFLENAEDNDFNDLDMQIKYPLIVNALSIPNGKKKIEEVLCDGFNQAYQDHEYDINPKTTLKIMNELLNK